MKNIDVLFVCYANYCRSPVAEYILKSKYSNHSISSAGINPIPKASMDPRSIEFLKSKNINIKIHNPKRINQRMINMSSLVLAMDFDILLTLKKLFKKRENQEKIKLLTFQSNKTGISDPYALCIDEYMEIMEEIYNETISLDL